MRRVWLIVALGALPVAARAQGPMLSGTVRARDGKALTGALIHIAGTSLAVRSDSAGRYRIGPLPAPLVLVRAEATGYAPFSDTVRVEGLGRQFDITMQRQPGIALNDLPTWPIDTFAVAPVVVTGAKRSQLIEDAFTSIALVEPEQLAARAVNTVDEAVDKAPGVQFLNGQVNIRGSTGYVQGLGSRVLLLVDGVPANQGDRGGINWDLVPVHDIARVEVVKGAGSALYGSAALGGVVNLITRDLPAGTHARVRLTGGVFADPPYAEWEFRADQGQQQRVDVGASHDFGRVAAGAGAAWQHSDGYREQDGRERWSVSGKGKWQSPDLRTAVDVSGAWTRDAYEVPLLWCVSGGCDTGGQTYQPFRVDTAGRGDHTVSYKGYAHAVVRRTPSERLQWIVRGSWLRTRFTDYQRTGDDYSVANRFGFEARGEVHPPGDRVVTTVGIEGALADVTSDLFGVHTQGAYAAYGESERRMDAWRLTTGARMDFLASDGGALTGVLSPRVGAVLTTPLGATRGSAGRAFRAPSIAEKFPDLFVAGLRTVDNPGLKPETAWSFELGHRATIGRIEADAAVFWTEAWDFIEPVVNQVALQIQFQNLTRARLAGIDLAATVSPMPGVTAALGYTYLHAAELAHDGLPARPLAFRPRHLLTLSSDGAIGPATVGVDFRFASRVERVAIFDGDTRVAATVLDLRAGVTRGPFTARLLVANALNYIYTLVPRTLAPVRTVSLALSWEY